MFPTTEPHHHSIFWVDIVDFTKLHRTDLDRYNAHAGMYRALHHAFRRARLPYYAFGNRFRRHWEDRGDGGFWLMWPSIPKSRLVKALPYLASALDTYNRTAAPGATIKLRVVLNAGEVRVHRHGAVGTAMNYSARLLDCDEFAAAFERSGASLGVITPVSFHDEVIRHDPDLGPDEYEHLPIDRASVGGTGPAEAMVRFFRPVADVPGPGG
ncbi:hypothetical protein ACFQ07_15165, partial [Actinomadura adrarensis]